MNNITRAAFVRELDSILAKTAAPTNPGVIRSLIQYLRGVQPSTIKNVALVGAGAGGAAVAHHNYKDWELGHAVRKQQAQQG